MHTAETHIKDTVFITLRVKFHCMNPLNKNCKEAEMGIMHIHNVFHAVDLKVHE